MANPFVSGGAEQPSTRRARSPIIFNRPQQQSMTPQTVKTQAVICLLCLFDGLRTPSIRRLVRKPRTVCNKALLTLNPSFFAPSSKNAIRALYPPSITGTFEISVDPSVSSVLAGLKKTATESKLGRVLLHYFGHGCHPPTSDGNLFFFSEDRDKYKPIKVANVFHSCPNPICIIMDCPSAGSLFEHIAQNREAMAFFCCSANEQLPISTDAPLDLFSSCLLAPFRTALWWHIKRHRSVIKTTDASESEKFEFIKEFFDALLEAIIYDTHKQSSLEIFSKDSYIASLSRGYVLAQRVMLSFGVHPLSIPELKPMASHELWNFWDTALDCAIALDQKDSSEMIFRLFITTFCSFPGSGVLPLFAFFIKCPEFHTEASSALLKYLDSTDGAAEAAAHSGIAEAILDVKKPSVDSLLVLAKIFVTSYPPPIDANSGFYFSSSKDNEVIKAGLLAVCCAIGSSYPSSANRLMQTCIDHSIDCAPFSSLLLGLLIERVGRLMRVPNCLNNFSPLLESKAEDIRASAAFLLGYVREKSAVDLLSGRLRDESQIVRIQAAQSIFSLGKTFGDPLVAETLEKVSADPELAAAKEEESVLLARLRVSVKAVGFVQRFKSNPF